MCREHSILRLKQSPGDGSWRPAQLGEIITALMQWHDVDSERRRQIQAELNAGKQYLNAPALRSDLIDDLLIGHLEWIAKEGKQKQQATAGAADNYLAWLKGALVPAA